MSAVGWQPVSGVFDVVESFQAAGDGVTDDTTAIQAAFDAAGKIGSGVRFPPGKYKVSNTLRVSGIGIRIYGVGNLVSVIVSSISTPTLLINSQSNGFIVERLGFEGNNQTGSAGSGNAISIVNPFGAISPSLFCPQQVIVRDCRIVGYRGSGAAGIYMSGGTALYVENCTITNCGIGIFGDQVEKAGVHFTTCDACDHNGIFLKGCTQWSISQSIFNRCGSGAPTDGLIYLTGCNQVTFWGCRLKSGDSYAVNLFDGNAINNSISLYACCIEQFDVGQTAIMVGNGCTGFLVDGCQLQFDSSKTAAIGIDLEQNVSGYAASGHTYRGNSIFVGSGGTIQAGIKLNVISNAAYGVVIESNNFGNWGASGALATIVNAVSVTGYAIGTVIRSNCFIATPGLTITNAVYLSPTNVGSDETVVERNTYSPFGTITKRLATL